MLLRKMSVVIFWVLETSDHQKFIVYIYSCRRVITREKKKQNKKNNQKKQQTTKESLLKLKNHCDRKQCFLVVISKINLVGKWLTINVFTVSIIPLRKRAWYGLMCPIMIKKSTTKIRECHVTFLHIPL